MNPPRVSVLIPSYSHARFIARTIGSIVEQDHRDLEVVIVDDASTDETRAVVDPFLGDARVRFFQNQQNLGASATISRAFSEARGKLILPFSSDDVLLPGRLARQVALFDRQPNLRLALCNGFTCDSEELIGRPVMGPETTALLNSGLDEISRHLLTNSSKIFLQGALIDRTFLQDSGGWDPSVRADDWVVCIKIFSHLERRDQVIYEEFPGFLYRIHPFNAANQRFRHLDLKKEVIDKFTPPALRREAMSNIYWESFLDLLNDRSLSSVGLFAQSFLRKPTMAKLRFLSGLPARFLRAKRRGG